MKTQSICVAFCLFLNFSCNTYANVPFAPYHDMTLNTHWDNQTQALEPVDLSAASEISGVKKYRLAFITDAGNCVPAWGAQTSYAVDNGWGKNMIAKLSAAGIDFDISLGGANGNDISKACSLTQLQNAYEQLLKIYNPKGLDFDIENNTADVLKMMNALKQIQTNHPDIKITFTLPVMPEGLVAGGEDVIQKAQAAKLNYSVNIMAMDYGPAYDKEMGHYAISAANNLAEYLKKLYPQKSDTDIWKMIEVTPMIGVNDVSIEVFNLNDVDTLRNFANAHNMGGLSMWSHSRDNPCADQWTSPICSGNSLQSKPFEFEDRFLS